MATDEGDELVVRMPRVEKRGSAIVLTCEVCQRYIPVTEETVLDDGLRELHYDCVCGMTSVIVREVR